MKHEIAARIRVLHPLEGVAMLVQRGRDELLSPSTQADGEMVFEFPLQVDLASSPPNFLGKYARGPKDARFVYVNSGTYAGQHSSWGRRAKISLMNVTREQVDDIVRNGGFLETSFQGIGSDGGPTCASVKGLTWRVVKK
jgi:hypothetical protein